MYKKAEIILVSELQEYMTFVKYSREVQVRLARIKELTEWKLNELKIIKPLCERMVAIRQCHGFKSEDELMKQVRRLAR